jgi:hypothetical protein
VQLRLALVFFRRDLFFFGGATFTWGVTKGLFNSLGWSSTILYVLLLAGALYCLYKGSQTTTTKSASRA